MHDISVLAFERAGDPAWYPSSASRGSRRSSTTPCGAKARLLASTRRLIELRGESPYDEEWFERPGHDDRITTRVDVGDFLWARTGALLAHATQVDPNEVMVVRPDRRGARRRVSVGGLDPRHVAGRLPAAEGEIEDDLFAGDPCAGVVSASIQYRRRVRQEGRGGRGPRRRRRRRHASAAADAAHRPDSRLHAGQAEGDRIDRGAVRAVANGEAAALAISRLASRP